MDTVVICGMIFNTNNVIAGAQYDYNRYNSRELMEACSDSLVCILVSVEACSKASVPFVAVFMWLELVTHEI